MFRALGVAGLILAVAAVIAGTVYFGRAIRDPLTASQLNVIGSPEPRETTFAEPATVSWEGLIEATLAGGRGVAVRRIETGDLFQAYMPSDAVASPSSGAVIITGRLTGVSCAYASSVFDGRCTPSVDIETIERLIPEPF